MDTANDYWIPISFGWPVEDMRKVKVKGTYPTDMAQKESITECLVKVYSDGRPPRFMTSMYVKYWHYL